MGNRARGFAVDAAIVVALAAVTAAYLRTPDGGWLYLTWTDKDAIKAGADALGADATRWAETDAIGTGARLLRAEMTRWWVATAAGMATMLLRSRLPLLALAGATSMSLVHMTSPHVPLVPLDLAGPVALYAVAAGAERRWVSYAAFAATLAAALTAPQWLDVPLESSSGAGSLLPAFVAAVAWLLGDRGRARREQAIQHTRDLERERDQQGDLATAAERARISRELHDVVAHGLSIVVIQAQAAAGAMEKRPTVARAALRAIEATGRDSLTEMRRLLGLHRPDEADLAPLPGAADLAGLVERVRAAGLPVDLKLTGDPQALPASIALSVYRIVQEALTNALKHAGPAATVDIGVHCGADAVNLVVSDTGGGAGDAAATRAGGGLRGMRERVEMLGGRLTVGDRPDRGFQVRASLPLRAGV